MEDSGAQFTNEHLGELSSGIQRMNGWPGMAEPRYTTTKWFALILLQSQIAKFLVGPEGFEPPTKGL